MKIRIETYDDLFVFIKRKDVTLNQAHKVVSSFLKVWSFAKTKEELLIQVKEYIVKFCYSNAERPFFLDMN